MVKTFKIALHRMLLSNLALFLCVVNTIHAEDTSAIEQLDFANGLFERGIYNMAINEYKKFIESYPQSEYLSEAYCGIAESHFFAKSYREAIEGYEKYTKLFPDGEKAAISILRMGQSYFFAQEYEQALKYFNQVKTENMDDKFKQVFFYFAGKTYRAKGDKNKAFEYFRNTQALAGKGDYTAYAFLETGDIFSEDSQYGKALEAYGRAYTASDSADIKSVALYKQAEVHFSAGDYSSSAVIFKKILSDYPQGDIAQESLANLLFSFFNIASYEELIQEYLGNKRLIPEESSYFEAHYIAASAYAELGRHDDSLSLLDKIRTFDSLSEADKSRILFKRADVLLKAKRFNEVLEFTEKELAGLEKERVIFLQAEAYYGLGNFDKSFELYKKIIDEFPASAFSGEALYGMAYAQYSLGKSKEALEHLVRYFEEGKDDVKRQQALYSAVLIETKLSLLEKAIEHSEVYLSMFNNGDLREKVLFRLGSLYSETRNYDKAAGYFRRFIHEFEKSDRLQDAYFLLAYNLQLSGRQNEALSCYDKISQGNKKLYYSALKNKALIYLNTEKENTAAEIFDQIIREFDSNDLGPEAYLWLAKHYLSNKKFDDALRVLGKAESKGDFSSRIGEIAYFSAEAHREKKDFRNAIKNYDKVLKAGDEDIETKGASHIGKGLCLVEMKDYDRAKKEFETAILEYPDDNTIVMRARFEIANIEQLQNNLDEACKLYMFVSILYKDDYYCPEALFRAGGLFEASNRKEEAIKAYQEIVATYTKSHLYEKAKEKITSLGKN